MNRLLLRTALLALPLPLLFQLVPPTIRYYPGSGKLVGPGPAILFDAPGASALSSTLVNYWKLEEASGTRVDSKGTNNLSPTNAPNNAVGKKNNAANFVSASNQLLSSATGPGAGVDWTVSLWANINNITGTKEFYSTGAGGNFILRANTNAVQIVARGFAVTITSTATISSGTWIHVVGRYNTSGNVVGLTLNGVDKTSAAGGANGAATGTFIGDRSAAPTAPVDGLVDEVATWQRALTTAEITYLYNSGTGRFYNGSDFALIYLGRPWEMARADWFFVRHS